jgi:phenylalanine-4-hydroxylase
MAVQPTVYGQTDRPPRGNYADAADDYTLAQPHHLYTAADDDRWARLYADRVKGLPGFADEEYLAALDQLNAAQAIPSLARTSEALFAATRWQLVAVPGLIPEHDFFALLAARKFPVTWWLRREEEFNYIVEPDIFHDFFGHVPLLFNPMFADYMQAYGEGGLKASALEGLEYLSRLYWYTVEFGLIQRPEGLRVYGAGILSSTTETRHSLLSSAPKRIAFNLLRVMRSQYKLDDFQATYFVINSYEQLMRDTAPDFTPHYAKLKGLAAIAAGEVVSGDVTL